MVRTELREIVWYGPAVLYNADLLALAALLSEGGTFTKVDSEYSFTLGSTRKKADSLTDLLGGGLPPYTDKFSAEVQYWSGKEIVAGLHLTCYHSYIDCQIHSMDATWYHGKLAQLRTFFDTRRPWYGWLKPQIMPVALGMLALLFGLLGGFALSREDWLVCGLMSGACLPFAVIGIQVYRQKWFPFVRIFFRDRKPIEWTPELTISLLSFLVSVIAVIVSIVK